MKAPVPTSYYRGMAEVWRALAQACDAVAQGRGEDGYALAMSALAKHRRLTAWPMHGLTLTDMMGVIP